MGTDQTNNDFFWGKTPHFAKFNFKRPEISTFGIVREAIKHTSAEKIYA